MSDTWKFNFNTLEWTQIRCADEPIPRSGHTASIYQENFMIIYGGIYEITKELNDMHIFDMKQDKWICLFEEINSPKKHRNTKQDNTLSPGFSATNTGKSPLTTTVAQKTQGNFSSKKTDKRKTSPKKKLTLVNKNEEVVIKLESPTSISMKNCFLIKNEHPSFEKCY